MAYAHSKNKAGKRHDLVEHLTTVAERARDFAVPFGGGDLAYWAGLWHDLGKFHPAFQQYLRDCEAVPKSGRRGPDHKRAGAKLALDKAQLLSLPIKGHHGGLPAMGEVAGWVRERAFQEAVAEALAAARATLGARVDPPAAPAAPAWVNDPLGGELFLRMVFSALVDADCLDTEAHFNPDRAGAREGAPDLAALWAELDSNQARLLLDVEKASVTPLQREVNAVRREVYEACLAAAAQAPGFFRLTVPTGGGKTRSGLAFALRHALAHGLGRVIVAIPYTSIIEQTAEVYREIFDDARAVLEHHSAVAGREREDDAPVTPELLWARLAAENFDAPIVVTTTVQLFESLLGARTSACRKLHHLARSVIVLDEVQTLPPHLLAPTLDVLRRLVANYGVSVVLCTATQPALDESPGFKGIASVREIVPDAARHFKVLERVQYQWPEEGERWSWERVADELRGAPRAMAVVNTKADALAILAALDDPDALHLSTLLCGAHRRAVLAEVRRRLDAGEPCRLVATQVVEAGVDLDFPVVLRALGPLDRIVQAAGRCNREGRLDGLGRVVVFEPEEGRQPPGAYRAGSDVTQVLLRAAAGDPNLHDPATFSAYFRRYYASLDLDREKVEERRRALDYPEVARRYRLIDDDAVSVVVRYRGKGDEREEAGANVDALLAALRAHPERSRSLVRRLQPYIVGVRQRLLDRYAGEGLAEEVLPGLWEWCGKYDNVRGLGDGEPDLVRLVVSE
ncbi:MAG TPA: CRISPR-associated helicase Cas3' [Thermomicrobiales bacterium]|nr:CRISPR-associated helicase Cas3' [Thermomicrobiales bacterium]